MVVMGKRRETKTRTKISTNERRMAWEWAIRIPTTHNHVSTRPWLWDTPVSLQTKEEREQLSFIWKRSTVKFIFEKTYSIHSEDSKMLSRSHPTYPRMYIRIATTPQHTYERSRTNEAWWRAWSAKKRDNLVKQQQRRRKTSDQSTCMSIYRASVLARLTKMYGNASLPPQEGRPKEWSLH